MATDIWHCVCGNSPCDGLECGVWLKKPRKKPAPKTAAELSTIRAKAWATRRAAILRASEQERGG